MHLTTEAREAIVRADDVLYLGAEPVADAVIVRLNARSRPLRHHYRPGVPRSEIYRAMAEEIVGRVRAGGRVCAAFYGHPAVLVRPAHDALALARAEGFEARLLPAVSALDCLFADLAVDPADTGLQTYDATEFLLRGRRPDPTAALVLWQVSVIGVDDWAPEPDLSRLGVLVDHLARWYPRDHEVVLYEASPYPVAAPRLDRLALGELKSAPVTPMSTLYVPPAERAPRDAELARRLGLERSGRV